LNSGTLLRTRGGENGNVKWGEGFRKQAHWRSIGYGREVHFKRGESGFSGGKKRTKGGGEGGACTSGVFKGMARKS